MNYDTKTKANIVFSIAILVSFFFLTWFTVPETIQTSAAAAVFKINSLIDSLRSGLNSYFLEDMFNEINDKILMVRLYFISWYLIVAFIVAAFLALFITKSERIFNVLCLIGYIVDLLTVGIFYILRLRILSVVEEGIAEYGFGFFDEIADSVQDYFILGLGFYAILACALAGIVASFFLTRTKR